MYQSAGKKADGLVNLYCWGHRQLGWQERLGGSRSVAAVASYVGLRYPGEIISHAVWLYLRFALSLRDVSELMLARGVVVSHETIRQWTRKGTNES